MKKKKAYNHSAFYFLKVDGMDGMKNRLLFFSLVLFLLYGCGVSAPSGNQNSTVSQTGSGSVHTYQTVLREASQKQDETICQQLSDTKQQTQCTNTVLRTKAIRAMDISLCSSLSGETEQKNCEQLILSLQARKAGDVKICDQLQDVNMKQSCIDQVYVTLATEKKDVSYCDKTSPSFRTNCEDTVYHHIALQDMNRTMCTKIKYVSLRSSCQDNVYYNQAMKEKKIGLCAKIQNENRKKNCETVLSQ
jgi:hypothetical protein